MTEELARVPLEPTGDEPLAQIDAVVDPLGLTEEAATLYIESGLATKPWTATRKDGIETFTSTDNIDYVRARPDEDADVIVGFARLRGMTPLRLVRADESSTVKRAERKKRRELRELRKRGYDV